MARVFGLKPIEIFIGIHKFGILIVGYISFQGTPRP